MNGERGRDFSRVLSSTIINEETVKYFPNKINPISVIFNDNEGEFEVELHEFDFTNLYSVNSYWQVGSCPHLFFINSIGVQEYRRELLIACSNVKGIDTFEVPVGVCQIVIRELEDEVTYIDRLYVNDKIVIESVVLEKGEELKVDVNPSDKVKIEGSYVPFARKNNQTNDLWYRNQLIANSNKRHNTLFPIKG